MISDTMQDYLKTVFSLQHRQKIVTTSELAERLGVTPASVTGMLKKMAAKRLVAYKPYKGVSLTSSGRKIALDVLRQHRLLELYLTKIVGVPWDRVHDEAERLEHAVSPDLMARLDDLLGQPRHDPHGSPIPAHDGRIDKLATTRLSDLRVGQVAVVAEVTDENPELLRYLGSCDLFPGTRFTVRAIAPFDGPITILIDSLEHIIGRKAAAEVYVHLDKENNTI
jgi:DtxR family Mn-dependent transcriptional regulator